MKKALFKGANTNVNKLIKTIKIWKQNYNLLRARLRNSN